MRGNVALAVGTVLLCLSSIMGMVGQAKEGSAIRGVVYDEKGKPMEGVWVTARNDEVATHPRRTVVTSARGEFSLSPLWPGSYSVRVRTYGYADRWVKNISAGKELEVKYRAADVLPPKEAAAQYPASYWQTLIPFPTEAEVKAAGYSDLRHWVGTFKLNCSVCHQLGTKTIRRPKAEPEWDAVLHLAGAMNEYADIVGRPLLLKALSGWSERVRAGKFPAEAPPRPVGKAAKYMLTEFDGEMPFAAMHDLAAAYVWDPKIGAKPPKGEDGKWVYAVDIGFDRLVATNIETGKQQVWPIPTQVKEQWGLRSWGVYKPYAHPHSVEVDKEGNLWILADVSPEDPPRIPMYKNSGNRDIIKFDPQTETWTPIPTQYDTHTLRLDRQGRVWLSGNEDVLCMYDPRTEEERHWDLPTKGFVYGIDVSPDGRVWYTQPWANRIGLFDPQTEKIKDWEVPAPGFGPRRARTDSQGNLWLPLGGSGHLGRFDPKTEKFAFWVPPGPQMTAIPGGTDFHYNLIVDRAGNVGKQDTVYLSGTESDAIIAFDPETEEFTVYRIPTLGSYFREFEIFDGAIWAVNNNDPSKHVEADSDQGHPHPRLVRLAVLK